MNTQLDGKWKTVADRHRVAVEEFLAAARGVAADRWNEPVGDGKWTPAQITQHVAQSYEVLLGQLRTGKGLTVKTNWAVRQLLRLFVLPSIMRTRKIPAGAKAPRALRPRETTSEQPEAIGELRAAAAEFENEILSRRGKPLELTHHMFGSVNGLKGLDFVAVHTSHHARQLAAIAGARVTA